MRAQEAFYLSRRDIKWKFIVDKQPDRAYFGIAWCLVKKKTPKKVLGCSYVTFEELGTILQLLTYVAADLEKRDLLTPAHFLVGKFLISLPTRGGEPSVASSSEPTCCWRHRERLSTSLWKLTKRISVHTKVLSPHHSGNIEQPAGK